MERLIASMEQTIIGQPMNVRLLITALLAGGHVLLEGAPGLGKTKLVRTLAENIEGEFKRIQFTPDMMPSDISGNVVWNARTSEFDTVRGPVFAHLVLADEINRAGPKTQAALLEAMEERQVTIHGHTYPLPDPFLVVATQNPVEYEGTYPLPEAQIDRFMFKLTLDYPSEEAETAILRGHVPLSVQSPNKPVPVSTIEEIRSKRAEAAGVIAEEAVLGYIARIVRRTRELSSVRLGASPRAGIAVLSASKAWAVLEGRTYVTPDDVKLVAVPALRHRLILSPQAELEGMSGDEAVREALASVPVPR
ncbi:AAA family ATPase [Paenibacillus oceani]|uniref:MoxR family ATPase n=1 Tax=Paenibacillus oceani TaxID=2772510 RepID=A0A927C7Y9_9BACL|nr:MoxR family ATPase [Paenibacillus oceani]MBD2863038.1 MoxR family ATPase [Paenibacillus oceani]